MSDTPAADGPITNRPTVTPLQFDRADYQVPNVTANCRICGQPMTDYYYEVNGQPFCHGCHEHLQATISGGSAARRFIRAAVFGSLAGAVGAIIYYAVREATNIEFGLIAIVVGLMVGKAVKKGSDGRGGWFYQCLAMFLTYTAISFTYVPLALKALANGPDKKAAGNVRQAAKPPAKPADAAGKAAPVPKPAAAAADDADEDLDAEPPPTPAQIAIALLLLIPLALALPILVGIHSPMALVIVGIGLYEAWLMNRRPRLTINGPYRLGPAGPGL